MKYNYEKKAKEVFRNGLIRSKKEAFIEAFMKYFTVEFDEIDMVYRVRSKVIVMYGISKVELHDRIDQDRLVKKHLKK